MKEETKQKLKNKGVIISMAVGIAAIILAIVLFTTMCSTTPNYKMYNKGVVVDNLANTVTDADGNEVINTNKYYEVFNSSFNSSAFDYYQEKVDLTNIYSENNIQNFSKSKLTFYINIQFNNQDETTNNEATNRIVSFKLSSKNNGKNYASWSIKDAGSYTFDMENVPSDLMATFNWSEAKDIVQIKSYAALYLLQ